MCEPLNHTDFQLENGEDGKPRLRIALTGSYVVLVMSSTKDEGLVAKQMITKIQIRGLSKACIDVTSGQNRNVVRQSLVTTTPIKTVPKIFFVVDGYFL